MAQILLLEDDQNLSKGIKIALEKDGHRITQAFSYFEGVLACKDAPFDLYILDINLPDGDGAAFCKEIRKRRETPIIFLTANDTEEDIVYGFQIGCDDYLAKPFSINVLRQRILAVLRRSTDHDTETYRYLDLEVNAGKMQVFLKGQVVKLTATEYKLLEYLIKTRGKVATRSVLLEKVWDLNGDFVDENTLSVNIRRLRQKIEQDPKNPQYIMTVFGIGYTFGK